MKAKYGKPVVAYCYANGVIRFRSDKLGIPEGALPIFRGPGKVIRREISAKARHGYDRKTLLVPGIPEAPDQFAGVDALHAWLKWTRPQLVEAVEAAKAGTYDLALGA